MTSDKSDVGIGERRHAKSAVLRESDHYDIARRRESGQSVASIAKLYAVSETTIRRSLAGDTPQQRAERERGIRAKKRAGQEHLRARVPLSEQARLRREARERGKLWRAEQEARAERARARETKAARWRLISDLYALGLRGERLRAAVEEQGFKTSSREKIFAFVRPET